MTEQPNNSRSHTAESAIGWGAVLAIVISYTANHNIWWAILHGIFGWLYVIYRLAVGMP